MLLKPEGRSSISVSTDTFRFIPPSYKVCVSDVVDNITLVKDYPKESTTQEIEVKD